MLEACGSKLLGASAYFENSLVSCRPSVAAWGVGFKYRVGVFQIIAGFKYRVDGAPGAALLQEVFARLLEGPRTVASL